MVSFGDMMTLILTFFILMASFSKRQDAGLVAEGVGSFVVALQSHGLPGILNAHDEASVFEEVRVRFNLPPEEDPDRRTDYDQAATSELLRAQSIEALAPHDEVNQPAVAVFAEGSSDLDDPARSWLDLLAPSIRPAGDVTLVLEGHASSTTSRTLAFQRALAVRNHLVTNHGFPSERIEARAWMAEIETPGPATRGVDARLVVPATYR